MNTLNEKSPQLAGASQREEQCSSLLNKGNNKLSKRQKKVFDLLKSGKHSATEISIKLYYSDPRSYIKILREKGIEIHDEWIEKGDVRFKRYWINQ
ncbi:MAG: hypothetical protein ACK5KP_09360 [Paludibacteraceae bacterium]